MQKGLLWLLFLLLTFKVLQRFFFAARKKKTWHSIFVLKNPYIKDIFFVSNANHVALAKKVDVFKIPSFGICFSLVTKTSKKTFEADLRRKKCPIIMDKIPNNQLGCVKNLNR